MVNLSSKKHITLHGSVLYVIARALDMLRQMHKLVVVILYLQTTTNIERGPAPVLDQIWSIHAYHRAYLCCIQHANVV